MNRVSLRTVLAIGIFSFAGKALASFPFGSINLAGSVVDSGGVPIRGAMVNVQRGRLVIFEVKHSNDLQELGDGTFKISASAVTDVVLAFSARGFYPEKLEFVCARDGTDRGQIALCTTRTRWGRIATCNSRRAPLFRPDSSHRAVALALSSLV